MANQVKDLLSDDFLTRDVPLEEQMICALIVDKDAINQFSEYLNAETFTRGDLAEIYTAILNISNRGEEVSPITVINELRSEGSKLDEVSVLSYSIPSSLTENATHIAKRLQALYKRRLLYKLGALVVRLTSDEVEPIDNIHTVMLDYLNEAGKDSRIIDLSVAIERLMKRIEENRSGNGPSGTFTGFTRLDQMGGLHEGDLIVVAGDTSNGKTSFALSIALNAILAGEKVAYYSLEMTCEELSARLIAMRSKVPAATILYKRLWPDNLYSVNQTAKDLPKENMFFDDNATNSFDSIISSIRSMSFKSGIKGAVVDYMQILDVNNKARESQEQLMAIVARRLKNLARELGIWIIALSQINRDSQSPQPTLTRLRSSGQIAEAADVVLLVYRPELYGRTYSEAQFKDMPTHNTALIEIAKGRNIGTGKFLTCFDPQITYFFDGEIKPLSMQENKEIEKEIKNKNESVVEGEIPLFPS